MYLFRPKKYTKNNLGRILLDQVATEVKISCKKRVLIWKGLCRGMESCLKDRAQVYFKSSEINDSMKTPIPGRSSEMESQTNKGGAGNRIFHPGNFQAILFLSRYLFLVSKIKMKFSHIMFVFSCCHIQPPNYVSLC